MKFKEKLNQAAGFTLVELIVVIAILAILAGVAVPAYSGYITQANKSNDETLASEIKQALLLAHYSGALDAGTSVIIRYNDTAEVKGADADAIAAGEAAMAAAFGENWKNTLKLSWDGWDSTGISGNIAAVTGSNFNKENAEVLLKDVAVLTQAVNNFLGGNPGTTIENAMKGYANQLGLDIGDNPDVAVLANLIPMMVADNLTKKTSDEEFVSKYNGIIYTAEYLEGNTEEKLGLLLNAQNGVLNTGDSITEETTGLALIYAQLEGQYQYLLSRPDSEISPDEKNALTAKWNEENAKIANRDTTTAALDSISTYMLTQHGQSVVDYLGVDSNTGTFGSSASARQDDKAFFAYMDGVTSTIPTLSQDTNALKDANYYTSDNLSSLVLNYITAGEVLAGETNSIVVVYDGKNVQAYPFDYTA